MISLVVLAAGRSTRMKSNKLLLKLDGETLIERVLKAATKSSADEVVVVLGQDAERIKGRLARLKCKLVTNPDYMKGQSESVKVGLKAVSRDADAVMILPADVALIDPQTINKIADEYRKSKMPIVIASHQKQSGHPILLDRQLFPEIAQIDEKTLGLKALIKRHKAQIKYLEVGTEKALIDIDTLEDVEKHFGRQGRQH